MNPETFKFLRNTLGLAQTDISASLGVSLRNVQRWEAGSRAIPEFAAIWIRGKLSDFLDDVSERLELFDHAAESSHVTLTRDDAHTRALALLLLFSDFDVRFDFS